MVLQDRRDGPPPAPCTLGALTGALRFRRAKRVFSFAVIRRAKRERLHIRVLGDQCGTIDIARCEVT